MSTNVERLTDWRDYYELTKPRVVMLIVFTAIVGMFVSVPGWPGVMPLVFGTLGIGIAILDAAGLSFLGLGIQPPTADWGSMVRDNATLITFGDITPLLPAGAIAMLTVGVNFVVDWFLHRSAQIRA